MVNTIFFSRPLPSFAFPHAILALEEGFNLAAPCRGSCLKPLFTFAGEAANRSVPSAAAVTSQPRARCVDGHFLGYTSDSSVQRLTKQFGTFWHHTLKTQVPGSLPLVGSHVGERVWRAAEQAALAGQGCQLFLLCTDVDVSICANTYNSVFL